MRAAAAKRRVVARSVAPVYDSGAQRPLRDLSRRAILLSRFANLAGGTGRSARVRHILHRVVVQGLGKLGDGCRSVSVTITAYNSVRIVERIHASQVPSTN
jgi:hypothetical protein